MSVYWLLFGLAVVVVAAIALIEFAGALADRAAQRMREQWDAYTEGRNLR